MTGSEHNELLGLLNQNLEKLLAGQLTEPIPTELFSSELEIKTARNFNLLSEFIKEISEFIVPLSRGQFNTNMPRTKNFVASPFKELHSKLMHLTWQAKQVSKGDYSQRIDLLGEFSDSFNAMVKSLDEKETELKSTIENLNLTNATKDKFFSIIAHDLRSPFNVLLGFSEILKSEFYSITDEEKLQMIGNIERTANHAFQLLESLLQWAKSQTGKLSVRKAKYKLSEICYPVFSLLNETARKKEIELVNELNDCVVFCDKDIAETVLRNLVSNSIKFTNNNGIIKISSENKNDFVEICVQDNGIGMSPEIVKKLFKIEESVSRPGTAKEKGSGLGLLICKEFVEQNDGEIRVESEPGKGSRFYFTIPVFK